MNRLYPVLKWVWPGVVATIAIPIVRQIVVRDKTWVELEAFWRPYFLLGGLGLGGLAALTYFSHRAYRKAEQEGRFLLVRSASELRPEDLGYQRLEVGDEAATQQRPHYPVYKERTATPHYAGARRAVSEEQMLAELEQGRGLLLIGPPVAGKTRTLYELIRRLDGWTVVRPHTDRPAPVDVEAFRGRKVVLLLDDLHKFGSGEKPDIEQLHASLAACAKCVAVAGTCRDGSPLEQTRQASNVQRVFEEISYKVVLQPPGLEEKEALARDLRLTIDEAELEKAPTYGFLTMRQPLEAMHRRYEELAQGPRDVLQALRTLELAGVRPFTFERIEAVAEKVHGCRDLQVRREAETLARQSFLRGAPRDGAVEPEPAYLEAVVPVLEEEELERTLGRVGEVLREMRDAEGLFGLGVTYGEGRGALAEALNAFEAALALRPENLNALTNKGVALGGLGRYAEALEAFEAVLELGPKDSVALYNKGLALDGLGRYAEALEAFEAALALRPDDPESRVNEEALFKKGVVLTRLDRCEEALKAYEALLALRPQYPEALYNKGFALLGLGRHEEALEAFNAALRLRPEYPEALSTKGVALVGLGRHEQGLEAFEVALALRGEFPEVLLGRALALESLGRTDEAAAGYEAALEAQPDLELARERLERLRGRDGSESG